MTHEHAPSIEALKSLPVSEMQDFFNTQIIPAANTLALGNSVSAEQRALFELPSVERALHLPEFRAAVEYVEEQRRHMVNWHVNASRIRLQYYHGETTIHLPSKVAYSRKSAENLRVTTETVTMPSSSDILHGGKVQVELVADRWYELQVVEDWDPSHQHNVPTRLSVQLGVRNPRGRQQEWPAIFRTALNSRNRIRTKNYQNFF